MHYKDAKSILSSRNGMNLYRGCTHGCIYCDSRSRCYQMEHAFEDVEIKRNAPELLEAALRRKRHRCMIGTGSMSDPYLPIEEQERLTRRCLEIVDRHGFGFTAQTKSDRILRDLDLLKSINRKARCVVQMTLTTYDEELCRILEPNVCTTRRRFEVLKTLRDEGIPTVVWLCPILPFINDTEENLCGILRYCFEAGVHGIVCFGMGVTLREGDREYFYAKLDEHFPGMKERYVHTFGDRYECSSPRNAALMKVLHDECSARGVLCEPGEVFAYLSESEAAWAGGQQSLF
ncbi:MAG TPA: radical SAM protein [Clostridia bacterium]|nr:radical SAM protein [Clostridia bacterium]